MNSNSSRRKFLVSGILVLLLILLVFVGAWLRYVSQAGRGGGGTEIARVESARPDNADSRSAPTPSSDKSKSASEKPDRDKGDTASTKKKSVASNGPQESEAASDEKSESKKVVESEPFNAEAREKLLASVPDDEKKYVVKLKSRALIPSKELTAEFPQVKGDGEDTKRLYVQFEDIPSRRQRQELAGLGVKLESYLADNTYYAKVMERTFEDLRRLSYVRGFANISYIDKLSEGLYTGEIRDSAKNPDGTLALKVSFDKDVSFQEAKSVIEALGGGVVSEGYLFGERLAAKLDLGKVRLLAEREDVRRVDEIPPAMVAYNTSAANRSRSDLARLHPNAAPGKVADTTTGVGVNVGIWDGAAVDAAHPEFQLSAGSRVTIIDNVPIAQHATHVAGTMGAAGVGNARAKGMAPGIFLFSWDFSGDVPTEMTNGVANQGITMSNNSWGLNLGGNDPLFGNYTTDSEDMDRVVRNTGMITVFAAGNDRSDNITGNPPGDGLLRVTDWDEDANYYDEVAPHQIAKNVITVGALHNFPSNPPFDHPRAVPPNYLSPDEFDTYGTGTIIMGDVGTTTSTITVPESEGVNETNVYIIISVSAPGGGPFDLNRLRITSPPGPVQRTWELAGLMPGIGGTIVLSDQPGWPVGWIQSTMNGRFGTTAPNTGGLVSWRGLGPVNTLGTWTLAPNDRTDQGANQAGPPDTRIRFSWSITVEKSRMAFSSPGPADDGRIKPDVVADGDLLFSTDINNQYTRLWGTSMSAPTVTGGIALLAAAYKREHQGEDPSADVVKAVVIQTAHDVAIDRDAPFLRQPLGPDYQVGYGEVDIDAAMELIEDDAVSSVALTLPPPTSAAGFLSPSFTNVTGMAFDPAGPTLYAVDINTDQLITIDTGTGVGTAVGAPGTLAFNLVNCLAFDPAGPTLYGVDIATDQLITINTGTGVGSGPFGIGTLGFNNVAGLAFNGGVLYGVDTTTDQLITIDTGTGVGAPVGAGPGSVGFDFVGGLSFDGSGTLFGSDADTDQLITINTANGIGTPFGAIGFNDVSGLAYNSLSGLMFGVDNDTDRLIFINPIKSAEAAPNATTPTIITASIEHGEIQEYNMDVDGSQGPIKVTLAWTDEPGDPNAVRAIVNNLDLELIEPDGVTVHFPFRLLASDPSGWLRAGTYAHAYIANILTNPTDAQRDVESNDVDNVEQVMYPRPGAIGDESSEWPGWDPSMNLFFSNAADTPPGPDPDPADPAFPTGRWTIRIRGTSIPSLTQDFALVSNYTAAPDDFMFVKEEFIDIPDDATPVPSIASFPVTDLSPTDGVADEAMTINDDLTVFINVSHPAPGELSVELAPPGGASIPLGVAIANGLTTINAGDPVLDPFDGVSTHNGLNGGWTLSVKDSIPGNVGTLESWGLKVGDTTIFANKANVIPDDTLNGIESVKNILDTDTAPGIQDIGITELDIDVDIIHPLAQDLIITLVSPAGTEVVLHNQTPDFGDPAFDRTTYNRLTVPTESLTAFNDEGVLGKWRLRVQDVGSDGTTPGITQYIRQWRMQIQGATRFAPLITPVVPKSDKTFVTPEDTQFTYNLTFHESDVEDSGSRLNWSIKGVDTSLFTASIDSSDLLTINPALNAFGKSQALPATVPVESLGAFEGQSMIGTWRLRIVDNDRGNDTGVVPGQLLDWQLILDDGTIFGPATGFPHSPALPGDIPDNDPIGGLISDIVIPNVPANDIPVQNTNDLNVLVNITHGDVTDLQITLEHIETRTLIKLHDQTGNFEPDNPGTPQDDSRVNLVTTYSDDVVTLTLTDSDGLTATQTVVVDIQPANDAPVLTGLPDQVLTEDIPLDDAFNLLDYASDVETAPSQLTYSIAPPLPDPRLGVSLDPKATGVFVDFNPAPDFFSFPTPIPVIIKVADPDGASDTDTFNVLITPVNDPPRISPGVANFSYFEDEPDVSKRTIDLNNNEVDVDNVDSELDWSVVGVDNSLHTANDPDPSTDLLIFTPVLNQNGVDDITLELRDSGGLLATQDITVTIIPVNDPPSIGGLPDISVGENTVTLNALLPNTLDDLASDVDNLDSELTYTIVGNTDPRVGVTIDPVERNIDIQPVQDFFGFSDVTIQVSDPDGLTSTDVFTITVTDGPAFQVLPNITIPEDTVCDDAFDLKAFAADGDTPDTDLNFTIVNQVITSPGNLTDVSDCGVMIDPSNDNIDVNPTPNAYGACRVTVEVTDGTLTDQMDFEVTIVSVNDPPDINPLPPDVVTDEDTPTAPPIVLTPSETDVEDVGTGLDWQVTEGDPARFNARIENIDTDEFSVTPLENVSGLDQVKLTLRDHGPAVLISGQIDFTNPLNIVDSGPGNGNDLFTIDINDGNGPQQVDLAPSLALYRSNVLSFPLVFAEGVNDQFILDVPGDGVGLIVDLAVARSNPVGAGPLGFVDVTGLAFDANTSTLYGVDNATDQLITIDRTTGVGGAVGGLVNFADVNCLAFDAASSILYGVDVTADQLVAIDTGTGVATGKGAAGDVGFNDVAGLAFNASTSTLYGVDRDTDQLITIDTTTGVGAAVGAGPGTIGFDAVSALSFDSSGTLFGADGDTDMLITINTTDGVGTAVGALGFADVSGLAFDSPATLFGVDNATDVLISIDPAKDAVYNDVNELINGNGDVAIGLEAAIDAVLANPLEVTVSDGGNNTVIFTRATAGSDLVFNEGNGALRLLRIPQGVAATAGDVVLPDIIATAARCEAAVNLAIPDPDEVIVLPDKANDTLYFIRRTPGPAVITGDPLGFPLDIDNDINDQFSFDLNDGFGPRAVDLNDTPFTMTFSSVDLLALQVETEVDAVLTAAGIDPREVLVSADTDHLVVSRASAGAAAYRSGPLSFPLSIANGTNDQFVIDLTRDGSNPVAVDLTGQTFTTLQDLVIEVERAVDEAMTNAGLDPEEVTVTPEVGTDALGDPTYQIAFRRATAGLGANIELSPGVNDALGVLNIAPGVAGTNDIELTPGANDALPSLGFNSIARANDLVVLDDPPNGALTALNVAPGAAPGGLTDSWLLGVTINPVNDAPTIGDIPDVAFDEGGSFPFPGSAPAAIDLDDFISDVETADADIAWSVTEYDVNMVPTADLTWNIDPNTHEVAIGTVDPDFNGQRILTFTATDGGDPDGVGDSPPVSVSDDVLVTVNPMNDAPIVGDIPDITFDEGGSDNSINLDDWVSDVETADADIVWTVTEAGGTTHMSVVIDPATRNVTISTVLPDFNGQSLLTFTATDTGDPPGDIGNPSFSPKLAAFDTVLVTINPINDAPVVVIPDFSFPEGQTLVVDLNDPGSVIPGASVDDVETENQDLTWTFAGNVNINIVPGGPGNIREFSAADPAFSGSETITFTATDTGDPPGVGTDPATSTSVDVVVTVDPVNSVPVVDLPDGGVGFNEDGSDNSIVLDAYVTDDETAPENMTWTFSGNTKVNVSIDPATRRVTFSGAPNFNGAEMITFTATDRGDPDGNPQGPTGQPQSGSDQIIVTVSAVNDAPVVTLPSVNFLEDSSANISANDFITDVETPDAAILLTYDPPPNIAVSIAADHVITFSAPADWNSAPPRGPETVTFHVTDRGDPDGNPQLPGGAPITVDHDVTVTVTPVNDIPVLDPSFPAVTFGEDGTDRSIDLDDHVRDVETQDADIVWSFAGNVNVTVSIDPTSHIVTFGAVQDFNGTETITFTATDTGEGNDPPASVSGDIVVTVTPINDAPTLADIPDVTFPEDGGPVTFNLDAYVTDPETPDDQIVWTFTGATEITVSIDANRVVTVGAPSNFNGTETVTFTATDTGDPPGNPQGPEGAPKSASKDVVITVTPVNDPPVVSDIPDVEFPEDSQPVNIGLNGFVDDVETPDSDIIWEATGGTNVTVNIVNNVAQITPAENWNGTETITFTATDLGDPSGDPQGDPPLSASDDVVVTVTPVNDPPVISIPDINTPEDGGSQTISLNDSVTDPETSDGEIVWSFSGNVNIVVTMDANNNVTFSVPANFNGTEVITFTATDTGDPADSQAPPGDPGAALSTSDDVIFSVTPVNDPPILVNIPDITFPENGSDSSIDLDNFVSDIETPDNQIVWTIAPLGTDISASVDANNVVTFTASQDWNGVGQVMFTATDAGDDGAPQLSATDIVTVTVTPINTAPVIDPSLPDVTFPEDGTSAPVALTAVDIETAPEDMVWTFSGNNNIIVSIAGPTVTFGAQPGSNFNGSETITFTATDGGDPDGIGTSPPLSASDAITVTVTPVNDPPVITGLPAVVFNEDDSDSFDLDDHINDVETAPEDISWQVTGGTNVSAVIDPVSHVVDFSAAPNFNGSETITFTATDTGDGESAPLSTNADVVVNVNAVNDAPVISPPIPNIAMFDGEQLIINLSGSETDQEDAPGPDLQWQVFGGPATLFTVNLTVDNFGNDILTINAIPDSQGTGTILLTLKDSNNATINQTVSVEVISKFIELVAPQSNSVLDPDIPPIVTWRGRRIKKAFFQASSSNTFPKGKATAKKRAKKNATTFALSKGSWRKAVKIARGNNNRLWARMSGKVEKVKPRQTLVSAPFLYTVMPSNIALTGLTEQKEDAALANSEIRNPKSEIAAAPTFTWDSTGVERFTISFSASPGLPKGAATVTERVRDSAERSYTPDPKTLAKLNKIAEEGGGKLFWRVDGRDVATRENISSAVDQVILTLSTVLKSAGFADANGSGAVDEGDTLTLSFTDEVEADSLAKRLLLGAEGDSFGDGATIVPGDSEDQAIVILGENPKLTIPGVFDPASAEGAAPQSSAIADGAAASGVGYVGDTAAVEPTYVDVVPMFVEEATPLSTEDSSNVGSYSDVALGDVDGDNDLDFIIATDTGTLVILMNDGNGNLNDRVSGHPDELDLSGAPALSDDDNDGHPEIVLPTVGDEDAPSEAGITPQDLGIVSSSGSVAIDADADGDLDLFVADYGGRSALFINEGEGVFYNDAEARLVNNRIDSLYVTSGDVDGDGDTDIVIVTGEAIYVLRNSSL